MTRAEHHLAVNTPPITRDGALPTASFARARDASPASGPTGRTFGAVLRRLRLERGLGTRRLAERSTVSREGIRLFEDGAIRPRRCTVGALAYGLEPDDPDRRNQIIATLVAAAGGEDALAPDHGWPRYRVRRFERGLLDGTVPLPAEIVRGIRFHKQADAAWRAANALLDKPGAMDDAAALTEAARLLGESHRLRDQAGPAIELRLGQHRIVYGLGVL